MHSHCFNANLQTGRVGSTRRMVLSPNVSNKVLGTRIGGRSRPLSHRKNVVVCASKNVVVCASKNVNATAVVDVDNLPLPPGDDGLPLIGRPNVSVFNVDMIDEMMEKYGPIFYLKQFGRYIVYISGLENIEKATIRYAQDLKGWDTHIMKRMLGNKSIIRLSGEEHHFVRKTLFPAFTASAINGYTPSMVERASQFLEDWASQDKVTFLAQARAFAFGIVADSIVGLVHEDLPEKEALKMFNDFSVAFATVPIDLPFTSFGKGMAAKAKLMKYVKKSIKRARDGDIPKEKALSIMVNAEDEHGNKLSDEELEDTLFTLLLAGYDTTSTTAACTILELGRHPDVLEKMRKEQEEVVAKYGPEITGTTLKAMPYLEGVIKESMRLTPVAGILLRRATRTLEFSGYKIPEGSVVAVLTGPTMRLQDKRWPGDVEFNPERFLTKEGKKPGAHLPFGMGPHSCLGNLVAMAELKIMFALIARHYDFELDNLYPEPLSPMTIEPKDGVPVKFIKREATSSPLPQGDSSLSAA